MREGRINMDLAKIDFDNFNGIDILMELSYIIDKERRFEEEYLVRAKDGKFYKYYIERSRISADDESRESDWHYYIALCSCSDSDAKEYLREDPALYAYIFSSEE